MVVELCQRVLDRIGIPVEWAMSDIMNCRCWTAVELLQHGMKVEEEVEEGNSHLVLINQQSRLKQCG